MTQNSGIKSISDCEASIARLTRSIERAESKENPHAAICDLMMLKISFTVLNDRLDGLAKVFSPYPEANRIWDMKKTMSDLTTKFNSVGQAARDRLQTSR